MPFLREIQMRRDEVPDFGVYPFSVPAVKNLKTLALSPGLTCFAGENGSGKSTLIEAIAILAGFNAEGGTKNFRHAYDRTESNLAQFLRPVRNPGREKGGFFLRAESMFNLFSEANRLGPGPNGWGDGHAMSHGESFLYVVQERFRPHGLYVLDEPEAALSPQRQLALLRLIADYLAQGCQFIMITVAGEEYDLRSGRKLLYFFNPTCLHCLDVGIALSKYEFQGDFIGIPTQDPDFIDGFLADAGLTEKVKISTDLGLLKETFPFDDVPYAAAVEDGIIQHRFSMIELEEPEMGEKLRELKLIE